MTSSALNRAPELDRRLLIGADYDGVAVSEPVGGSYRAVDPASLPLSAGTVAALRAWAGWYDRGWSSADGERQFDAEGRRLWAAVRSELGSAFAVAYFSVVLRRCLEPEADAEPGAAPDRGRM